MSKRKKVLLLSTHDSHLQGHAWSYLSLYDKTKYEVDLVTLYSQNNDSTYAIVPYYFIYKLIDAILGFIDGIFFFGSIRKKSRGKGKYCFFRVLSFPVTAGRILRKSKFAKPDIIVLYWHDGFITPKIVKELYYKTNAKIVFVFTDEFPLGGGCHYPCECVGYELQCDKCPALVSFTTIASYNLSKKIKLLADIPKIVISPTAGLRKAKTSRVFSSNTVFKLEYSGVDIPTIPLHSNVRDKFGINEDEFVIMFGALNINEERKGLKYLLDAFEIISSKIDKKVIALIVGDVVDELKTFYNIEYKFLGKLSFSNLCEAYVASNVYISPTIADSGPMMLKYSIACGTPVISFPIGYAIDFIKHKETGYLAEMYSSNDLADGILYFYNHQENKEIYYNNCIKLNKEALLEPLVYNSL